MARPSEITSTQKLLRVIRKTRLGSPAAPDPTDAPLKQPARFKFSSPAISALKKSTTVGIDIGRDYLRLVRVAEKGRGNWQILDRRRLAVPPQTPTDSPEFAAFLKSALASVCGSPKRSRLWVLMSAAQVEMYPLTIPKVPHKQIGNVVYWTIKKESAFNEKEMILDFEVQGEVSDQGAAKLAVMAYTAPRQEIEEIKSCFSRIGWPLTGITIAPFALQNLFRTQWVPAFDMTVASLYIEAGFSRIDIYTGGNLVMTRGIKAGLNSMIDALTERFNERKASGDAPPLTPEQGSAIIQSLSSDEPLRRETDVRAGLEKEEIFTMIEPALERLARQVERTFEHYSSTKPGNRIDRIFVSGAMHISPTIVDYIGTQLATASAIMDPLFDEESSACPDVDDQHCLSERIAFGMPLGLALSDNEHTPNLLLTYKDREHEASLKGINRAIFATFIAVVLVCLAVFLYQNHDIDKQRAAIAGLRAQLAAAGPPVDRNQIMELVTKVKQTNELSKGYSGRYLGLALIGELAAQTPAHIRLTDLKISLGPPPPAADAAKKEAPPPKGPAEEITLEGLILGERQTFETSLAAFTMALEASPLFKQVTIQKNSVEPYLKSEALYFILNMKVEELVHG